MDHYITLEFDKILNMLADCAWSQAVKSRCRNLRPTLDAQDALRRMDETTKAKHIIEQCGTPPLPAMEKLNKVLDMLSTDAMLGPEEIGHVSAFLLSCRRMKAYLKKADTTGANIAWYGGSIITLQELDDEIARCIVNGIVADRASPKLSETRRQMALSDDQIKAKLHDLLRKNKSWVLRELRFRPKRPPYACPSGANIKTAFPAL